jgi:hypothetical protein
MGQKWPKSDYIILACSLIMDVLSLRNLELDINLKIKTKMPFRLALG